MTQEGVSAGPVVPPGTGRRGTAEKLVCGAGGTG